MYIPKISVIMPVYNSKDFLINAIESVLKQSFSEFELILVDDGSTDGSEKICDQMALRDTRIRVIHQENAGLCNARNTGISEAKGEYLAFIDNDDEYAIDLLRDNYDLAIKYNADIVKFGREFITLKDNKIISRDVSSYNKLNVINTDEIQDFLFEFMRIAASISIWNALYRRAFINKIGLRFNPMHKTGHEDIEFNILLYPQIHILVTNPKVYYKWIKRVGHSSSAKFSRDKFHSIFRVLTLKKNLLEKFPPNQSLYNFVMSEELRELVNYICHPQSDVSLEESNCYIEKFKQIVGRIYCDSNISWKQKIQVYMYNKHHFELLILIKKLSNYARFRKGTY